MTRDLPVRLGRAFLGDPSYPPEAADRATFRLLGLELPVRATVAVVVMVVELVYSRDPAVMRIATLQRFVLLGAVPLGVVLLIFRDDPRRYGLRLGDWRAGLALAVVGTAVVLPIIVWAGGQPAFVAYYIQSATDVPDLTLTNALDVSAAEFMFRGFLMFTLLRTVGPLAVLLAAVPFTLSHFGKPELETLSTLLGGSVFGWLNWRTGSILYSMVAHLVILTTVMVVAMGAR